MVVEETLTANAQPGETRALVRRPEGGGPFPVIVFFHHGPGLDEGSKQAMDVFCNAGYLVLAPDRYRRYGEFVCYRPEDLRAAGPDSEAAQRFRAMITSTTEEMVASDLRALLERLSTDKVARPGPMGCVGYCVGARSVLRTMASQPQKFTAGVALHPSFCVTPDPDSPHREVSSIGGRLYVGIGGADESSSPKDNEPLIEAVEKLGPRGIVEIHEGAEHGFAVPGPSYQQAAADRSYQQALRLFHEVVR